MRVNLTHNDNIKTFDDVACHVELEKDRLLTEKSVQEAFMTENKSRERKALDATKARVRVFKAKEKMKPVIVDRSVSAGNGLRKEARTRIVLIVINPVTLLMIALSQR